LAATILKSNANFWDNFKLHWKIGQYTISNRWMWPRFVYLFVWSILSISQKQQQQNRLSKEN